MGWYVVETLPRKEVLAQVHLEQQAYICFVPRFRKVRRHARRVDTVLAPLFPNYLFIRIDPENHPWRSVNGTIGVKRLVGSELRLPSAVPERAMKAILDRCEGDIMTRMIEDLVPGSEVRLAYGPFADAIARIESLDGRGRVSVLLDILGRRVSVKVATDCLMPG